MSLIRFSIGTNRKQFNSVLDAAYQSKVTAQMRKITANMKHVIAAVEDGSAVALLEATRPMFNTSQVLVPKDTGALKASGFHEIQKGLKRGARVNMGYAKNNMPEYAALVHENLKFNHAPPTQAKYLEEAFKRHINKLLPRFRKALMANTGLTD